MNQDTALTAIGMLATLLVAIFGIGKMWGSHRRRTDDLEKRVVACEEMEKRIKACEDLRNRVKLCEDRLQQGDGKMNALSTAVNDLCRQSAVAQAKLDNMGEALKEVRDIVLRKLGDV